MGQRSSIAIKNRQGVTSIDVQWGAASDQIEVMIKNYDTPEKVNALMKVGTMNNLGRTPNKCHVATRMKIPADRNESVEAWKERHGFESTDTEFMFLFENNEWKMFAGGYVRKPWKEVRNWQEKARWEELRAKQEKQRLRILEGTKRAKPKAGRAQDQELGR